MDPASPPPPWVRPVLDYSVSPITTSVSPLISLQTRITKVLGVPNKLYNPMFLFKNVWFLEEGILQEIALDRSKGEREINWQSLVAKKLPKNTKVFTAFSTWAIN